MSTQQDIYAASSESRPPMLDKENYVPWSSRLLRRMIAEPGDGERDVNVNETFHKQTDDELSERELKQIEADDQAIQTILLGLPEDIYAAVDSCETAQEIWLRDKLSVFKIRVISKETELSAEQAFWSWYLVQYEEPNLSSSTTIVEVLKELPKVSMTVNVCERCVPIETELQKDFIKKECYDTLFKKYNTLEKHCISLEVDNQLKKEIFQRNNLFSQQSAPTFDQLFELNDLKAQSQEKDTALKETLSKLKGKAVVTEAVTLHPIDPKLLKIDVAPLAPKLRNTRTALTDYLRHTQEETATLREIVESERLLNPLNTSLDYVCKYTKRIQELLIILQQTCPCINDLGTKLMAVTPKNNDKKIRFTEHIPLSGNTPAKTTSSTNVVSN
nr:hypothetical protein [Tanacetum cinerariifolium]